MLSVVQLSVCFCFIADSLLYGGREGQNFTTGLHTSKTLLYILYKTQMRGHKKTENLTFYKTEEVVTILGFFFFGITQGQFCIFKTVVFTNLLLFS